MRRCGGECRRNAILNPNPSRAPPSRGFCKSLYNLKVPLFSAENGIVMECSEKIQIPNQVAQNWFSYFCYWPFATDDSSKLFWQLPESSPLWNAEIAHDFGADKSLDPDSWTWLKVFSPTNTTAEGANQ